MSFLVERCGEVDRTRYIQTVKRIQTGTHFGIDVAAATRRGVVVINAPDGNTIAAVRGRIERVGRQVGDKFGERLDDV